MEQTSRCVLTSRAISYPDREIDLFVPSRGGFIRQGKLNAFHLAYLSVRNSSKFRTERYAKWKAFNLPCLIKPPRDGTNRSISRSGYEIALEVSTHREVCSIGQCSDGAVAIGAQQSH